MKLAVYIYVCDPPVYARAGKVLFAPWHGKMSKPLAYGVFADGSVDSYGSYLRKGFLSFLLEQALYSIYVI